MPRLELILLHSANAGGYNAGRLLSATTSRFMASAFVFMVSIRHLTARLSAKDRERDERVVLKNLIIGRHRSAR